MITNTIKLIQFSKEKSLRNDCVYHELVSGQNNSPQEYYTFNELFDVIEKKVSYSDIEGSFKYCQIGDVGKDGIAHPVSLNFDERNLRDESYYKKIEKGDIMLVEENDILMSFLLPQNPNIRGKFIKINKDQSDILFSTAFLRIKAKVYPQILFYCLQSVFYKNLVYTARIKKGYTGYTTLNKDDLKNLRFNKKIIDTLFSKHKKLTTFIINKENAMNALNDIIQSEQSIIDTVFQHEFEFDYDKFNELRAQKFYPIKQSLFSNNPDLRFSAKYHRPAGDFVMEQLTGITNKRIKHFLSEPIVLGASVSPKNYDESGEYSYISMATIKEWRFDAESAATVNNEYALSKSTKVVQKNDIILARSGEGTIGKVAILTDYDIKGIFADFTMRIRLTDYNPIFAYYYFRSVYFQYLIEIYKKGLGNNTNIFPIVMQEFPIPNISLEEQQRIVDVIQSEINKQDDIKSQIDELRSQIDNIIMETITE